VGDANMQLTQSGLSFPELVLRRAERDAEKIAYRFIQGATLSSQTLTFHELWEQAAALAQVLQSRNLGGERSLLVCRSQKNFVIAFFACLLAGTVAVPTAVPRRESLISRLKLILRDARARAIIFDCDELRSELVKLDIRSCLQSDAPFGLSARWSPWSPAPGMPAVLQYTSGSTGDPKGVVITHHNLIQNCAVIQKAMAISADSSVLLPLPLFHDMGLLGVLQAMHSGSVTSFLSPSEFVQYPERWLQIISAFQIDVSGGPNFMYELAARVIKPAQIADIDLSLWRVAFCGAEPIRAATIARFSECFENRGFKREAFYPCYGMAEATLFVTGNKVSAGATFRVHEGTTIVGCGAPQEGTHIEIVDIDTFEKVPEGCVGEIWVRGSSVAQGYWMQPELTRQTFGACLRHSDSPSFLRTGDLGFVADGELYVSGRVKDVVIINGKKYAPQDIEHEAQQSHPGLRGCGGAAFGVADRGSERLVVVFELTREWLRRPLDWPRIASAVRSSLNASHGITPHDVVLIKPGALPRTSSGKIRRGQARKDYLAGHLHRLGEREEANSIMAH
jgi:acyl-CoA synthetase (AMP-forming)/AMP-acid ligase II